MLRGLRKWRRVTSLSDGIFLKYYIYDRVLIRPKRKVREWKKKLHSNI